MLPVSKYEELLHTVRSLKQQTIRVHQLASPLLDTIVTANERLSSSASKDIGNLPIPDDCWDKHQRDFVSVLTRLNGNGLVCNVCSSSVEDEEKY